MSEVEDAALSPPDETLASATAAPPPATPVPVAERKKGLKRPRNLLLTFVAVLAGTIGGTLIANAAFNSSSSTSNAMGNWMANYGSTYLGISKDMSTLSVDSNSPNANPATVRADCARLASDVSTGQSDPAMPAKTLEPIWSAILTDLSKGASTCESAIDQKSLTLLSQAQTDFQNASAQYIQLGKAVQKIH
jgi:hypothetical protein